MKNKEYWFAKDDPKDVIKEFGSYEENNAIWSANPIVQSWVRNYIAYYSCVLEPAAWDTSLLFQGEQGELIKMVVPEARSLIRQLTSIITKQKLAFQAIAETATTDSVNQIRLADAVAADIVKVQQLDQKADFFVEQSLITGLGYLYPHWRTDLGAPYAYDPDQDMIMYQGMVKVDTKTVYDIYYDFSYEDFKDVPWVRIRTIKNRWDLVAQHPDLREKILALPSIRKDRGAFRAHYYSVGDDDLVYVYDLYHKPTPAMPSGRMLFYSDTNTVYFDGPNHYKTIPLVQLKPECVAGTGFGMPKFSELLPAQEMFDTMFSSVCTNNASFAVQNIAAPRGANISAQDIQGMNWFSFTPMPGVEGGGMPKAIQLTQSAPETYKLIDYLDKYMERLSMINGALRGEPPSGVTAGTAIATLASNALEFINSGAKAYRACMRETMMHCFNAMVVFAKADQWAKVVGKNSTTVFKKYTGKDLEKVRDFDMTEVNPVMQTVAGRVDLAEKMLQAGFVKSPQDYVKVLDGQPVSTMFENEQSSNDLIMQENESLLEGKPVTVAPTDDDALHIYKHGNLLNNEEVRMKSDKVQAIMEHIMAHAQAARNKDPFLEAMLRTGKMPQGGPAPSSNDSGMAGPPPEGQPVPGDEEAQANMPSGPSAQPAKDLMAGQR